jgi:hypothetical protein
VIFLAKVEISLKARQKMGEGTVKGVERSLLLDDSSDSEYKVIDIVEKEGFTIRVRCIVDGVIEATYEIEIHLLNEELDPRIFAITPWQVNGLLNPRPSRLLALATSLSLSLGKCDSELGSKWRRHNL